MKHAMGMCQEILQNISIYIRAEFVALSVAMTSSVFFRYSLIYIFIIEAPLYEFSFKLSLSFAEFNPEELRTALLPTLEKLYRQEPESVPFRYPVDPQALGIPDYFEIVKKPMDLGTIRSNILNGKYSDPWEYVDDVWLMFDNAWLYNRKTSRVYRYCTKVRISTDEKYINCTLC